MELIASSDFGKKITKARKEKKISRAKLGEMIGLHETTIKKYEDGNIKNVSIDKIKDFSVALDIPFVELVTLDDSDGASYSQFEYIMQIFNNFSNLINLLNSLGLSEDDIKNYITKYIFNDPDSPLYKFFHTVLLPIYYDYDSIKTKFPYGTLANPFINQCEPTFAMEIRENGANKVVPSGAYALISQQAKIENNDLVLVSIDETECILRRFYKLNETTIILQPDTTYDTYKTQIFEGDNIIKIKILGKYIGHVSGFNQKL